MTQFLKTEKKALLIWFVLTAFFAYQFILRLSVGIMRDEIMIQFAVDAAEFGILGGIYYLGYSGIQIPIGIMLDRYNFRYVTAFSMLLTALGAITFVTTESWNVVLIGRFLIGAGSAIGFLAVNKCICLLFPKEIRTQMIGLSFTLGLIGAALGGTPTHLIIKNLGYYYTFILLSMVAVCFAALIVILDDTKCLKYVDEATKNPSLHDILSAIMNKKVIMIGIAGGFMVGSLEGFADIWGIPYLNQIYGFSQSKSIGIVSFIFYGMCIGGPILTYMLRYFTIIKLINITGIIMSLIFLLMFYKTTWVTLHIKIVMIILGIMCCYQVLVFALVSDIVTPSLVGVTVALTNCLNMSFGYFFHKMIGMIMNSGWQGKYSESGAMLYSYETFVESLRLIPIGCIIGIIIFTLINKKQNGKLY